MKRIITALLLLTAGAAQAAERIQHPLPGGSTFPIARAVEVTADATMIWHSGMTPRPQDPDAEQYSEAYWGDTEAQAISVFERMQASLEEMELDFGNVVKMTVFLVAPEGEEMMDFAGFMRAYTRYFGADADQMNLPARSAVQVAGLARPGMLVEVEAIFVRQ